MMGISTPRGANDLAQTVAVQPDGKVVVARIDRTAGDYLVARYFETGMLDASFGDDGVFSIPGSGGALAIDRITVRDDGEMTRSGPAVTVNAIAGAGDRWLRQPHRRVRSYASATRSSNAL